MSVSVRTILLGLVLLFSLQPAHTHNCLNENGQKVDWFIALRVTGPAPRKYVVFDSLNDSAWRTTTEQGLVQANFAQINAFKDEFVAWNDEAPTGKNGSETDAHSKGFLVYSKTSNSGFYYMHSIPKYPDVDVNTGEVNYISPTSSDYGQSVLCHTLDSEAKMQAIYSQIKPASPYIYFNNLG
jgi:deoxyribonuclease II